MFFKKEKKRKPELTWSLTGFNICVTTFDLVVGKMYSCQMRNLDRNKPVGFCKGFYKKSK